MLNPYFYLTYHSDPPLMLADLTPAQVPSDPTLMLVDPTPAQISSDPLPIVVDPYHGDPTSQSVVPTPALVASDCRFLLGLLTLSKTSPENIGISAHPD